MKYLRKEEGFRGQELYVIPSDVLRDDGLSLLIRNLQVTDAGYFPRAAGHQKSRSRPIEEGILLFCREGEGFVRTGKHSFFLKSRQACFLKGGESHIYGASDHAPWSLYWMHLRGELLPAYLTPLENHTGPVPVGSEAAGQVEGLFRTLLRVLSGGYSREILLHSGQLAGTILTTLLYGNGDFHPDISTANSRRLETVIAGMQERIGKGADFPLKEMAAAAGLSVPHFSELFRKGIGYSPSDYFTRLRIQKACRLLELTDRSVQDVAARTGYADRYYFSRVFRKIMGLPPTIYRDRVRSMDSSEYKAFKEFDAHGDTGIC